MRFRWTMLSFFVARSCAGHIDSTVDPTSLQRGQGIETNADVWQFEINNNNNTTDCQGDGKCDAQNQEEAIQNNNSKRPETCSNVGSTTSVDIKISAASRRERRLRRHQENLKRLVYTEPKRQRGLITGEWSYYDQETYYGEESNYEGEDSNYYEGDEEYYEYATGSETSYQAKSPTRSLVADAFGSDLGVPQVIGGEHEDSIQEVIEQSRAYMDDIVMVEDRYRKVRSRCLNDNALCAFWAALGECEDNPGYMNIHCAPVCRTCDLLHVEARCPVDPEVRNAFQEPGDLDAMFERIVNDPANQAHDMKVLSRPSYAPGDGPENATYELGMWMVLFDNAISDEDADRLVDLGGIEGYERSTEVGEEKPEGTHESHVSTRRTSMNTWCNGECYSDPAAIRAMERISNITGIPEMNQEYLQLLRYEPGQYYHVHNDLIEYQADRPCGLRILTFYYYLSDVEEGGGTNFPRINATVMPKKGRAVLWPSVLNEDPNRQDSRSDHQALTVQQGIKYGANAWIHQRDFKNANEIGCT